MQHRHLLPNEIDLLLDGEIGFGVAPLRTHVEECVDCRARLADAKTVTSALDNLPRFAPSSAFATRVLSQVQVVEPWHVALTSSVTRLVPRTGPMRIVMAASAGAIAVGLSSAAVWLSFRTDVAMYLAGLANDRIRVALSTGFGAFARTVFGSGAIDALSTQGPAALGVGIAVVVIAAGSAAFGLRALTVAARRTRE
jgi:hypothetical protein